MAQTRLSRRTLLAGFAAGSALAAPRLALADGKPLVVANWGGDWSDRTVKFVEAPLVESQGYHIERLLGMEPERKTKMVAEARFHRGSIDVAHFNDSDAYEMDHQGVLATLDLTRLPNYADTVPALRTPYFVPWLYSGVVIVSNSAKISEPPTSYEALWDKKWAGRIGLTNQLYFQYMMMAGLIRGGTMTDAAKAKANLAELKSLVQPRIYATHQMLQAALANGEVDLTVEYKARGLQWAHDGMKLAITYPKEGAIAITFGACMPKTAPNPEGAYTYLNAMLDRAAMAQLAAASYYAPANTKSALPPDLRAVIDFTEAEQTTLRFPDHDYVSRNTSDWLDWWNKSIAV